MKKVTLLFVAIVLTNLCFISAQNADEFWKYTLNTLSENQIIGIDIVKNDKILKVNSIHFGSLLKACKKIKALDNPDCRCLPTLEGRILFFFKNHKVLMVELAKDHWVNASFSAPGKNVPFILKDKNNVLYAKIEKIVNPTKTVKTMCKECQKRMFAMAIGKCPMCSGMMGSIGYHCCEKCAAKKGICKGCGKKIKN